MQKFVYVRRLYDGKVMDIPASDLEETLKRGLPFHQEFEEIKGLKINNDTPEIKVVEVVQEGLKCPLCEKVCKNAMGLSSHKKTHKV